jgi:hypothetical protein
VLSFTFFHTQEEAAKCREEAAGSRPGTWRQSSTELGVRPPDLPERIRYNVAHSSVSKLAAEMNSVTRLYGRTAERADAPAQ